MHQTLIWGPSNAENGFTFAKVGLARRRRRSFSWVPCIHAEAVRQICQALFASIQRSRSRTSRNTRRSARTTGNLPPAIMCSTASFVRPK